MFKPARYGLVYLQRHNYHGTVTSIIWEQPKWIKRDSEPATMWQVFEVGLLNESKETEHEIEFVRCSGYAPVSLSPGYNVEFFGPREYSKKHRCEMVKIKTIDFDTTQQKDSELIEISRYAKGISFKTLLTLRHKFKDQLCATIKHQPESLESIPGFGSKRIKALQRAISKLSIEVIQENEHNISELIQSAQKVHNTLEVLPKTMQLEEWIKNWCDNDPNAVGIWFKKKMRDKLTMYSWNNHYAPTRSLIGKIENYCNHNGDGNDEMDIIMQQSHLFRLKLSTMDDSDQRSAQS